MQPTHDDWIDVDVLRSLIKRAGISFVECDTRCGLGRDYTRHLVNGHTAPDTVQHWVVFAYARELGVDAERLFASRRPTRATNRLSRTSNGPIRLVPWDVSDFDIIGRDRLPAVRHWLTYTRCSFTYFMPDKMQKWYDRNALENAGWSEEMIKQHLASACERRRAEETLHASYNYRRDHVMRAQIFREAHAEDPHWAGAVSDSVRSSDGHLKFALAEEDAWQVIDRSMAKLGFAQCCCISICDDDIAIVNHSCGSNACVIESPTIVSNLYDAVSRAIAELGGSSWQAITRAVKN